jgi:hypothetical protein
VISCASYPLCPLLSLFICHLWSKSVRKSVIRSTVKHMAGLHCRYPADRIPLHTSFKLWREAGRVATHYRVFRSTGLASLCGRALVLSRISRGRTPLPCAGGLWGRHTSCGSEPCFRRTLKSPRVPRHRTPPPCSEGSGVATWLRTSPPSAGGLRGGNVSRYPWETNKELLGYNG